jgi:hypothetical protein
MIAYDRADWHYGSDFPKDLAPESGGTHIGMFVAWAILRGLEGELHREESPEALEQVRRREMTGRDFLMTECDEKFWEEDLNEEGNAFARAYYDTQGGSGLYLADYECTLGNGLPSTYHVEDTWAAFDQLCPVIDRRFAEWKATGRFA